MDIQIILDEFHRATDLDLGIYDYQKQKLMVTYAKPLAVIPAATSFNNIKLTNAEILIKQHAYTSLQGFFNYQNQLIIAWSTNVSMPGQGNYDRQIPLIGIDRFKHLMFCLFWMIYHQQPHFTQNVAEISTGANMGITPDFNDQLPTQAGMKAETQIMSDVQAGNLRQYNLDFREFIKLGNFGRFNASSLRNKKDIAISATTLYTRAAIRGGLPIAKAYQTSDEIINGIEEDRQISNLYEYTRAIGEIFINQVTRQQMTSTMPPIYRAQQYIDANLTHSLKIDDVALSIGMSKSRLEHLFKQETHQSIKGYFDQQRIKEAQQLLNFSDSSITELADRLGFSSPSQFTQVFQRVTGMTPRQYRQKIYHS